MEFEAAGGGELVKFVAQGRADSLDAGELVVGGEPHDVPVEIADRFGALLVGADFEGVFILEFQQQGDFVKNGGKILAGHRR